MRDYQLHRRLGYRASRLARIMQNRLEGGLSGFGLTRLMWCVLTGVGEEDVRTPSDLAHYVGVTRPAMSRLLRSLERKGYVARTNGSGRDGRAVEVMLTSAGQEVLKQAREVVNEMNAHFAAKLPPDHLESVLSGLALLAEHEGDDLTDF